MSIRVVKILHAPKKGNRLDEYEDAYAIKGDASVAAIADGATEACFSKEWANILVRHAISSPPESSGIDKNWLRIPAEKLLNRINLNEKPWYVQNKFNQYGTAATFLWLGIDEKAGAFKAVSVGDSCLFWMQKENQFQSFPVSSDEEFTHYPYLVSNREDFNQEILNQQINHCTVPLPKGRTRFYLMTDSLAQWVFREWSCFTSKHRKNPFHFLRSIKHNTRFQQMMYEKIDQKEIANDDLTVIIVEVKVGESDEEARTSCQQEQFNEDIFSETDAQLNNHHQRRESGPVDFSTQNEQGIRHILDEKRRADLLGSRSISKRLTAKKEMKAKMTRNSFPFKQQKHRNHFNSLLPQIDIKHNQNIPKIKINGIEQVPYFGPLQNPQKRKPFFNQLNQSRQPKDDKNHDKRS